MRFFAATAVTAIAFAAQGLATCVLDSDANKISQNFAQLFSNYSNTLADHFLTSDFVDQVDSVAWLINNGTNCPKTLGQPTFNSKADFEAAQGSQPNLPFDTLNVFHDCNNVFIRWAFPVKPQRVQGISILAMQAYTGGSVSQINTYGRFQLKTLYTEFNSGAFAIDFGVIPGNRISPAGACPN